MKKSQLNQVTGKPRTQADFIALGGVLAKALIGADNVAFNTKRETLLTMAKAHAGSVEATKHILEGLATEYIKQGFTESITKARKSEAKAVFDAVKVTLVTNDNFELLNAFVGGYHDFIAYARELRDANKPQDNDGDESESKEAKLKPLSDNQLQDVQDKLARLNVEQVLTFANQLTSQVPQYSDNQALTGLRQFSLIANITNAMMNNDQFDAYTLKLATSINELVMEGIGTITKALQDAKAVSSSMESNPYDVVAVNQ